MIDSQEKSQLRSIVEKYKQIQENLTEAEKIQEKVKSQIENNLKFLEETKAAEEEILRHLEEKYGKKFTPTELFEIVYND